MGTRMAAAAVEGRTRNEAETRLLSSALRLFAQKGYEGTSVREIIEAAGVTRPVLYYYFENKEHLFRRLLSDAIAGTLADCEDVYRTVRGCRARLKELISRTFARAEAAPEAVRLILQALFAPPPAGLELEREDLLKARYDMIENIVRDGLESGELSGGDPGALTLAFAGLMDMYVMAKTHDPTARLTAELGGALVDLFLDGAAGLGTGASALVSPFAEPESHTVRNGEEGGAGESPAPTTEGFRRCGIS